ncbi:hypothetical protein ACG7TL_001534 [Trametes sanguinea]
MATHRPLFFSAAHSEAFERARRQSEDQAQAEQTLLWKRGFHVHGGRPGWGYYLEPSTSTPTATDGGESAEDDWDGRQESSMAGGEDSGRDQREGRALGRTGADARARSPDSDSQAADGWARRISSHGALLRLNTSPLALT